MSYAEDALQHLDYDQQQQQQQQPGLLLSSMASTSAFASRLLEAVEASQEFLVQLPPGLLNVIAGHVLQEAAQEPYGLRGEEDIFLICFCNGSDIELRFAEKNLNGNSE